MQYDEFIEQVQTRAHLSSQSEAQLATQATLETFAAYISWKERHDAASQLPKNIKTYLQRPIVGPGNQPYPGSESNGSLDEFIRRLSTREGVPKAVAIEHARAVLSVLREALSEGEFEDIRADIPAEIYNEFFAGN
jgi:uncharacterized protein (DUF2267 family)